MIKVATKVLQRLIPLDPAYELYEALKREAEENIARFIRERDEIEGDR